MSEVYSDLAKEVETMYKAQVRPIKEDYKKWKLDYLYNQRQLQERRFKEGVEDVKTQSYEQAMKQAHLSWKQVSERLREDAKVSMNMRRSPHHYVRRSQQRLMLILPMVGSCERRAI